MTTSPQFGEVLLSALVTKRARVSCYITLEQTAEIFRKITQYGPICGKCLKWARMWRETGLLSKGSETELSKEKLANITIATGEKTYFKNNAKDIKEVYALYKKGFLAPITDKPGLYPTEQSNEIIKKIIKQIYILYDLLKYRILNMNEEDITLDDCLKVYLVNKYCGSMEKLKIEKDKKYLEENTTEREAIVEEYKEKFLEYRAIF